jgi:hypothetical protein
VQIHFANKTLQKALTSVLGNAIILMQTKLGKGEKEIALWIERKS